ncbi:hypothetical protein V5799_011481 [Amblyomma americanum]|uniref:Uncharacterized protein n=1 Tax=Amblyomma americanum TaxID=6943 RepID=A0AAQ4EGS6_AMBAM
MLRALTVQDLPFSGAPLVMSGRSTSPWVLFAELHSLHRQERRLTIVSSPLNTRPMTRIHSPSKLSLPAKNRKK